MKSYIRDLGDGTLQRVMFADDPGESTPQWRLDETPRNSVKKAADRWREVEKESVPIVKKSRKKARK